MNRVNIAKFLLPDHLKNFTTKYFTTKCNNKKKCMQNSVRNTYTVMTARKKEEEKKENLGTQRNVITQKVSEVYLVQLL